MPLLLSHVCLYYTLQKVDIVKKAWALLKLGARNIKILMNDQSLIFKCFSVYAMAMVRQLLFNSWDIYSQIILSMQNILILIIIYYQITTHSSAAI